MTGIDPEIVKRATLAHVNASRGAHGLSPLDRLPWTDHCDSVYGYTRAALEAVLPDLIRQAKAEALREAIAQVSDDAAMDAWWEASDDGWAVPPYLPARFLRHWLRDRAYRIERGES